MAASSTGVQARLHWFGQTTLFGKGSGGLRFGAPSFGLLGGNSFLFDRAYSDQ